MGATAKQSNPLVRVKFFFVWSNWTWDGIEFDPKTQIFYGYVDGHFPELGDFSLEELKEIKGPLGLGIERDLHFKPTPLSEIQAMVEKSHSGIAS